MPWETFISHEVFKGPQISPSVSQEEGGPSRQQGVQETETTGVPVFVTYERGTRKLFVAAERVLSAPGVEGVSPSSPNHRKMLSPLGVEGALPSSSIGQVQVDQQHKEKYKGKKKMHEEDPSEGKGRDFVLIFVRMYKE